MDFSAKTYLFILILGLFFVGSTQPAEGGTYLLKFTKTVEVGGGGNYTLNVTSDSGSGSIDNDEVFNIVGLGATNTAMSGNTLTINSTDTDTTIGNCSGAGSCTSIAYLDHNNTGDLNITGNFTLQLGQSIEWVNSTGDQVAFITANATHSIWGGWFD